VEKDCTQVEVLSQKSRERLVARAVIVAAGFNPKLTSLLGLGRITNFAVGAQMEVETQGVERIEVYFSQEVAPGFFAWLVPISKNRALTGVISPSYASLYLKKLLASSFCQGKIIEGETRMRQKVIPLGTLSRTYRDRVLVVGDSAGQVKPTTGGGIYFGHLGAEMASEVLSQSLKVDDLSAARLSQYERRWKAKMGKEISIGCWARKLYGRLNDHQIEHIFRVIESYGIAESLLRSPDFSFDWHSKLIVAALKRGVTNRLREFVTPPMSKP
jgi:flavin-dependent dehydrogenase